jgi:hypothetical protein
MTTVANAPMQADLGITNIACVLCSPSFIKARCLCLSSGEVPSRDPVVILTNAIGIISSGLDLRSDSNIGSESIALMVLATSCSAVLVR